MLLSSTVVKGIVCHKNVQNRRMQSRFKNPRLLLLGGALEYHRVSNQLSSLDTLLQQVCTSEEIWSEFEDILWNFSCVLVEL